MTEYLKCQHCGASMGIPADFGWERLGDVVMCMECGATHEFSDMRGEDDSWPIFILDKPGDPAKAKRNNT